MGVECFFLLNHFVHAIKVIFMETWSLINSTIFSNKPSSFFEFMVLIFWPIYVFRSSHPNVFCKNVVLRNFTKFTGKYLYQTPFLIKLYASACNFIKKETLVQVFSCAFCEISKNTFCYRTSLVTASICSRGMRTDLTV